MFATFLLAFNIVKKYLFGFFSEEQCRIVFNCYIKGNDSSSAKKLILILFSLEKGGNSRSKKRYVKSFSCKHQPSVVVINVTSWQSLK